MSCPRFFSVDSFLFSSFLFFCHSEDNLAILSLLSLLSLLNNLLNGVRVLTEDIFVLEKSRRDSRGTTLFGPALVGVLYLTQAIAHRIHATVFAPHRDGKTLRAEYRDLFRGLRSPTGLSLRRQ